jgi:hypothetical protein
MSVVMKDVRRKKALASSSMVEASRRRFELRVRSGGQRSDLKEKASDLNQSEVAAKDTREWEREIGTKWNYH